MVDSDVVDTFADDLEKLASDILADVQEIGGALDMPPHKCMFSIGRITERLTQSAASLVSLNNELRYVVRQARPQELRGDAEESAGNRGGQDLA